MEYLLDPRFEEINAVSILRDNLMNHAYDAAEFKDQMKYILPILYERLIGLITYFLKLIVIDEMIKSMKNYHRNDQELDKIRQFAEDDGGMFDQEYKYCATLKGLEMCKFVDLFCMGETYRSSFQDFYYDCHDSRSEKEELSFLT